VSGIIKLFWNRFERLAQNGGLRNNCMIVTVPLERGAGIQRGVHDTCRT